MEWLTAQGGRVWIPMGHSPHVDLIELGGRKHSEFELESGTALDPLIYPDSDPNRINSAIEGECQSGQMDLTVNQAAMPTQVRILPPP